MKTCVFLYAAQKGDFADQAWFNGASAREKSAAWAKKVDSCKAIDVIETEVSLRALLRRMERVLTENGADFAVYAWADCPFLNSRLTSELIALHTKYKAEYTFADGYPYGVTPELIDAGTVRILAQLASSKSEFSDEALKRDSLFSLIKTDINSFEIETFIAPEDYRYLRLDLSCSSVRSSMACRRLGALCADTEDADLLCETARKSAEVQRTLPAFYNVQIHSGGKAESIYEPSVPAAAMEFANFKKFLDEAASFSPDAVVGLSFLGEPSRHADFILFAEEVLKRPEFSLLIETDAQSLSPQAIERIHTAAGENPLRGTGYKAVNWIVKLDACDEATYKSIRSSGTLAAAEQAVHVLKPLFPNAVYPQMLRMKCNEDQLERFYRKWKADGTGELIIQKYDTISGFLEDRRPADLSPAVRIPCWHIKRDLCILADGQVPRCKAAVFCSHDFYGNAFTDGLESVWNKGNAELQKQLNGVYAGDCGKSDEYYTFNF